jgi:hypothetical protein
MAEAGQASLPQDVDPGGAAEALRARGAERFDPVGWCFIEALARRAAAHRDPLRGLLDRRLAQALADYGARFERAEREAGATLAGAAARFPEAAEALRQHCEAGEFGAMQRLLARLEGQGASGPLAELLAQIGQHAPQGGTGEAQPLGELKSLKYFRSTWSRLSLDHQLSQAFAQAPENAGPFNPHYLVLQTLRLMRDTAPDYLEQFLSYADALLWLDQADSSRGPARKTGVRGERDAKRKTGRGKPG